jgi:hypothetical protein
MSPRHCRRRILASTLTLSLGFLAFDATAQTWAGERQGPALSEIVTIDETGETAWLWGREDVAGDGLGTFAPAEQAIDARAAYLTTEAGRLWFRLTLSATVAPEGNLVAYLFINGDDDVDTGRSAAATEIDPTFTEDPTDGGYEAVLVIRGDGTADVLWTYDENANAFVATTPATGELTAESGVHLDPLRLGADERGYVQAQVALSRIGVNAACEASFFVRSTNDNATLGDGDLDVGAAVGCQPTDTNGDAVPDVLEPTYECTRNDDCAAGGVCWNNRCWLAATCADNTDCAATEICDAGLCRATGGDGCQDANDCGVLICDNGSCVACTTHDACGIDRVCGPDGRCVDAATADNLATNGGAGGTGGTSGTAGTSRGGTGNRAGSDNAEAGSGVVLAEDEKVQGGACACRVAGHGQRRLPALLALLGVGLFFAQLRRLTGKARP